MKVKFVIERETPGTVRYKEEPAEDEEVAIGTLYVKKPRLPELGSRKDTGFPEVLYMTLSTVPWGEEERQR